MILTQVRKNKSKNGIFFLLDEPASNLHIHPQEKILKLLGKLAKEKNVGVMYGTHSPFLIDDAKKENIFIAYNSIKDEYAEKEKEKEKEKDENKISCKKFIEFTKIDFEKNQSALKPIEIKEQTLFFKLLNDKKHKKIKEELIGFMKKIPVEVIKGGIGELLKKLF